jgi:hypothetical protein
VLGVSSSTAAPQPQVAAPSLLAVSSSAAMPQEVASNLPGNSADEVVEDEVYEDDDFDEDDFEEESEDDLSDDAEVEVFQTDS